jgi:hypothetical protein
MIAHIIGRVMPERTALELSEIERTDSHGAKYWFKVEASQFHVRFETTESIDPVSAFIRAQEFARIHVKALGFCLGTGYYIEGIHCIIEGGESLIFGVRPGGLEIPDWQNSWESIINLMRRDIFFRHSVRDYTDAMTSTEDCPFLCYRSIEGICQSFDGKWNTMHAALGSNKDNILTYVKAFADPIRHSNWSEFKPTTSEDRFAML